MTKHLFTFVVDISDASDDFVDLIQVARQAIGDGVADLYDDNVLYEDDEEENPVSCNTCGGTTRWQSTTEESPTELVDLGPCPDCDRGVES